MDLSDEMRSIGKNVSTNSSDEKRSIGKSANSSDEMPSIGKSISTNSRKEDWHESIYAGLPPVRCEEDSVDVLMETECRFLEITANNGTKFYVRGLLAELSPRVKLLIPHNGTKKLSLKRHDYDVVHSFCKIWSCESKKDFKGLFEYLEDSSHQVCLQKMLSLSYYFGTRDVQDSLTIAENARTNNFTIEEMIKAKVSLNPLIVVSSDSESSPSAGSSPDSVYNEVVYDIDYSNDNWLYKYPHEVARSLLHSGSTETPLKDTEVKETVASPSDLHASGINDSGGTEIPLKDKGVKETVASTSDLHATSTNDSGSTSKETTPNDTEPKETVTSPSDLHATSISTETTVKYNVVKETEASPSDLYATGSSNVVLILTEAALIAAFTKARDEKLPSIFYFTTEGTCRMFSVVVEALGKKFPHVRTYKILVDQEALMSTLSQMRISSKATILFFQDGEIAAEMDCADATELRATMARLYNSAKQNEPEVAIRICPTDA